MKKSTIPILCAVLFACGKHPAPAPEIVTECPCPDVTEERYDMNLYQMQTDAHLMLHSLIRYDDAPGKFFLDLSREDAALLGLPEDAYHQAVRMADKMNEVQPAEILGPPQTRKQRSRIDLDTAPSPFLSAKL